MQRERLHSGSQGSLFMLPLEREAGIILVARDFGFLLCTRHCAYLSFILLGRYHHCPFYRWHFWGPEKLRYLPHYVVICRPGNLVCLPSKTGHISLPMLTASTHGRSEESRSSRQWWDLQLTQIAQEKQHRNGERGWPQESLLTSWKQCEYRLLPLIHLFNNIY